MSERSLFFSFVLLFSMLLTSSSALWAEESVMVYTVMEPGSALSDDISLDDQGNIYACDAVGDGSPQNPIGTVVSKISPDFTITTFADGFNIPIGNYLDDEGNLFVTNLSGYVYKVTPEGDSNIFANIFCCIGVDMDSNGNLFVCAPNDQYPSMNKIKKITPGGYISTYYSGAPLLFCYGLTIDEEDNLYISNFSDGKIFRLEADNPWEIDHIATIPDPFWGCIGFMEYFEGDLYIGGYKSHRVYRADVETGEVSVLAGTGEEGMVDGPGEIAQFYKPNGIAVTSQGDSIIVYVTDDYNKSLRKIVITDDTDISDNKVMLGAPLKPTLKQNFPNPFNPSTTIAFTVPQDGAHLQGGLHLMLNVYDVSGKLIKTLIDGEVEQGYHSVIWDGTDGKGNTVSSGLYFYRLTTPIYTDIKSCLMLK